MIDEVERFAVEHGLLRPGDRVLAAVSGGADSVVLLDVLARLGDVLGFSLACSYVDHGLREGTSAEADLVAGHAARRGVSFSVLSGDAGALARGRGGGIEDAARRLRFALLEREARRLGCTRVALGHTRDDQAETVIIRLVRGTGIDGLAAMAPLRDDLWIRPLLVVARQGVREYARRRSLDWLDDPTNADPRFLRNRVRREVIPLLEELDPGIAGRLASLAGEARRVRAARQPLVRAACEHAAAQGGEDWTVRASELRRMDPALAALVVREVLRRARGDLRGVGRVHVEAILAAASRSAGSTRVDLPGPVRVVRSYDDVVFTRRPARRPDRHAAVEVRGPGRYVLGPHAVRVRPRGGARSRFPLVLRHRRPGDRLAGRTRKLKRLLIDLKVPADLRDMVPLLASGAEVVWAGGLFVRPGAGVEVEMDGCGPSPYLEWLQSRRE